MSYEILTLPVGQLQTNCYVVYDLRTKYGIIIDPGDEGDFIASACQRENIKPKMIIATHGHFDHILGTFYLQTALDIPLYIHPKDEFLVDDMVSSAKYFLGIKPDPRPRINRYLAYRQIIRLGPSSFTVVHTPGHTPGSVCLYDKKNKIIFCGDLIFESGGVGRTDFKYSSEVLMRKSLTTIKSFGRSCTIYPGHGRKFILS